MNKKYLVIQRTYFVDAHNSADEGGILKFVSDSDCYAKYCNKGEVASSYSEEADDEDDEDENEWTGSEDGYNAEYHTFEVKEISESEAVEYQKIIKAYEKL